MMTTSSRESGVPKVQFELRQGREAGRKRGKRGAKGGASEVSSCVVPTKSLRGAKGEGVGGSFFFKAHPARPLVRPRRRWSPPSLLRRLPPRQQRGRGRKR